MREALNYFSDHIRFLFFLPKLETTCSLVNACLHSLHSASLICREPTKIHALWRFSQLKACHDFIGIRFFFFFNLVSQGHNYISFVVQLVKVLKLL